MPGGGLGTYNVLWQLELCRRLRLPYLYLGYWIAQSRKMAYKINFQPIEGLVNGHWQRLPRTPTDRRPLEHVPQPPPQRCGSRVVACMFGPVSCMSFDASPSRRAGTSS